MSRTVACGRAEALARAGVARSSLSVAELVASEGTEKLHIALRASRRLVDGAHQALAA